VNFKLTNWIWKTDWFAEWKTGWFAECDWSVRISFCGQPTWNLH